MSSDTLELTWSPMPPTEAGWYWWKREADDVRPEIVEVAIVQDEFLFWQPASERGEPLHGLWGPMIPPAEKIVAVVSAARKAVPVLEQAAKISEAMRFPAMGAANQLKRAFGKD